MEDRLRARVGRWNFVLSEMGPLEGLHGGGGEGGGDKVWLCLVELSGCTREWMAGQS